MPFKVTVLVSIESPQCLTVINHHHHNSLLIRPQGSMKTRANNEREKKDRKKTEQYKHYSVHHNWRVPCKKQISQYFWFLLPLPFMQSTHADLSYEIKSTRETLLGFLQKPCRAYFDSWCLSTFIWHVKWRQVPEIRIIRDVSFAIGTARRLSLIHIWRCRRRG